ncbi:MAG: YlmC/YmxH family sporulation protein [Oscillospiraceae bacterium]|nr:YlmC/YmxH family sporulation protein [Oscillospiraceae bacterium]MBQ6850968.1 YlmC/YmxH family sporulation protein [Oscillospiraceae bacterium]
MVSLSVLCEKDIISISTGRNIGRADDIEFNETTAKVENLVVFGRPKLFGLLGRGKDIRISWSDVITVGQDVILINSAGINQSDKNGRINVDYD